MSPSPLLPQPRSIASEAPASACYRRVYALRGAPGGHAVQLVRTRISVLCGQHPLAEYRGHYAEYFRFADDGSLGSTGGQPVHDVHDFDLRRDGWCPMSLRRLTRQRGLRDGRGRLCARSGELRLVCEKRCLLGPAEVEGVAPVQRTPDGGEFGFLAEAPAELGATLTLSCCQGRETCDVPLSSPVPAGMQAAGRGRFTAPSGWQTHERYTYSFALQQGQLDDAGGYVEALLRDACPSSSREHAWPSPIRS